MIYDFKYFFYTKAVSKFIYMVSRHRQKSHLRNYQAGRNIYDLKKVIVVIICNMYALFFFVSIFLFSTIIIVII